MTALLTDRALPAEEHIEDLLTHAGNEWLHLRHAQAGCFIARIERA